MIAEPGAPVVNITAYSARRQVSGYAGSHVNYLTGGSEPALILARGRLVWRVPVLLSTPRRGVLGQVGSIDVDARTGQLILTPRLVKQLEKNAGSLVD